MSVVKGWNQRVDAENMDAGGDPRFPVDLAEFARKSRWSQAVRHKWVWQDHINLQEGRAHLLALEWLSRQPSLHNCRQPFLIDNQAVVGALVKGRSSSRRLLRICRKAASYFMFTGIKPICVWIPTECQPADEASRA